MKEKKVINGNWVVAILLAVFGVIIYFGIQPKESETVLKEEIKPVKLEHITTLQQKENDFNLPENYLIDFYELTNSKNWEKLATISQIGWDKQKLEDYLSQNVIKGFKIIKIDKQGKHVTYIKANVTFEKFTGELQTKEVNVLLEASTDFTLWRVAPLTTY